MHELLRKPQRWLVTLIGACVLYSSCRYFEGTRRYYTRSAGIQHFQQEEKAFERVAEEWLAVCPNDSLTYRPWVPDAKWNSANLRLGPDDRPNSLPVGISSDALQRWIEIFKRLNIAYVSVIGTKRPEDERYLEIDLQQAGAHYGFLYVPPGHINARNLLTPEKAGNSRVIDVVYEQALGDGWFYFEADK